MNNNYVRVSTREEAKYHEHALAFFDDSQPADTLRVVGAAIAMQAELGHGARVAVFDRRGLVPRSLRAQVCQVGIWHCPKCDKEDEACTCSHKDYQPRAGDAP